MACAQQAITRNLSRLLIDVGDLDTVAATNRLYLNCKLYSEADDRMFNGVVINPEHVLHQFLTEREQTYNLRLRPHGSKTLLTKLNHLMNRISLLGLYINIVIKFL